MRAMAWLAFALYAINSALLMWLHTRERNVHPISHAVSDYGIGASAHLFKLHGVFGCLAALAIGAATALIGPPLFAIHVVMLLMLLAVGRLGVALSPTGADGQASTSGRQHLLYAILTMASATMAIYAMTDVLVVSGNSAWLVTAWNALRWVVVGTAIGMLATRTSHSLRGYFGLFERAFIAASTLWFMALAVSLALT